ncbi:MAG: A/G-specific adenine glycosylase [Candidatus Zixiibacteriota bacterium]|nr:MAG: A/G-specific adenine glycosylase [candidate division Zixibacteria bacterium]
MHLPRLQANLLAWYNQHRRDLPWRRTRDPYAVWVSEIMLQQTQVETVIPYYDRFLQCFPDLAALAAADLSEVLKAWEGMGYYARARHLHRAARSVVERFDGRLPEDYNTLMTLPGLGEYTAAAVASLAFGRPVPMVDANIRRVLARWIALRDDPASGAGAARIRQAARDCLYPADPGRWNQAVMELGALVCIPRTPRCEICPVTADCQAFQEGATREIPARRPRKAIPHHDVTAGLISDGRGNLLITRRPEKGLLGGLWEFPGGKQEPGESLEECLARELREELAIEVEVGEKFAAVDHAYSHFRITLHVFRCRWVSGEPQALGVADWKWIRPSGLRDYAFPRADRWVIERIMQEGV